MLPEPWAGSEMPSMRDAPPWHMTEMIEAEPALARRILERHAAGDGAAARLAAAIRVAAAAGGPISVVGCGTSEHAALGAADILAGALTASDVAAGPSMPLAIQALESGAQPATGWTRHRDIARGRLVGDEQGP